MIRITRIDENQFSYQENESAPITLTKKLDKKTQRYALALPENELNRKWVQETMIDKNGGTLEITEYKETRTLSNEKSTSTKKSTSKWTEYLTDEEKTLIDEIKERALKRAERAEIEAEIKRLTEKLNQR